MYQPTAKFLLVRVAAPLITAALVFVGAPAANAASSSGEQAQVSASSSKAEKKTTKKKTVKKKTKKTKKKTTKKAAKKSLTKAQKREKIIRHAKKLVGTPYLWGGTTPKGFDCSGFTQYVAAKAGVELPRTSGEQRRAGKAVKASKARAGDLVWAPGHIGVYAGKGKMYDAPKPGKKVSLRNVWMSSPVYIRIT